MDRSEIEKKVAGAVHKAYEPIVAEIRSVVEDTRRIRDELEAAVFRHEIERAGCLRAGGEAIAVSRAKAAGWVAAGPGILRQFDAEGEIVGRDFSSWLAENRGALAFAFRPDAIAHGDRSAFSANLDAIARGNVIVRPRG